LLHQSKKIADTVAAAFNLDGVTDAFSYGTVSPATKNRSTPSTRN